MRLLMWGAAAVAGCLLRSEYEKRQIRTVSYRIEHEKIPDGFDGVRILLLADLHGKSFGPGNEKLYTRIRECRPDYILGAGDMIVKTRPHNTAETARFLGRLTELCPVYCGNGNHELALKGQAGRQGEDAYRHYTEQLQRLGVVVLADSTAVLRRGEQAIDVTGLDLGLGYYAKALSVPMRGDYLEKKLGKPQSGRFHILLGHYPNYFPEYAAWGADLVLAGHMHGGTVRLPGIGGLMSPNFEFFPVYDRGMYRHGKSCMIVSPGLGTHSVNIRFGGNYPALSMICLKKKLRKTHGN